MTKKMSWRLAAGLGSLFFGGIADLASAAPTDEVAAAETPSEQATSKGSDPLAIDEIVVTAQRRSERLVDVPLSVSAETGAELTTAGVVNTQDLTNVIPGLKVDRVGAFTTPAIRGISTQIAQPGAEANVAIYLDGVYLPNQATNTFDLPDIDRIEVSKGPQGTLFGRNATGGAIQIFTLGPSFTSSGKFDVGYGSFNDKNIDGYFTGPLIDGLLAGSISAYFDKNTGYLKNIIDDRDAGGVESENVRGKLLFTPASGASFLLTGFYSRRHDASNSIAAPINGNSELASVPGAVLATGAYNVALNPAIGATENFYTYGGSLKGTFDTGPGTVSVLLAGSGTHLYIDLPASFGYSVGGGTQYFENSPDTNYSAELNFASKTFGQFSFVTGLFAYYDKAGQFPVGVSINGLLPVPTFEISLFSMQDDHSYAAYFEGNYDVTDRLSIIAGIRESYERRAIFGGQTIPNAVDLNYDSPTQQAQSASWNSATPRVSIRYKVADDSNVYATYSQGFKSGVFNDSAITNPPVKPEKVDAYEVGYKAEFAHRFTSNLAAYYYKYKDIQVNAFETILESGVPVNLQENLNAASAKIYGAEWDGTARVTQALSFSAGASWLHAKYESFPNGPSLFPLPGGGNESTIPLDESGNYLVRSPQYTLNAAANYSQPLANGRLDLSATVFHTSSFYFDSQNRISEPAYTLLNLRSAYAIGNTGWTVAAFVKNATNKVYDQGVYLLASGDGRFFAPPRTFGGTIQYAF
jgi:iron complex outermembrane recepter protein